MISYPLMGIPVPPHPKDCPCDHCQACRELSELARRFSGRFSEASCKPSQPQGNQEGLDFPIFRRFFAE